MIMAVMMNSHSSLPSFDLHNLNLLADAAMTMLDQQQRMNVDLNLLADAAMTMNDQQQRKNVNHRQQMNMNKKNEQRQKSMKKKKNNKKEKRSCPRAPCRVQQQRAPERWLLLLVAEHGGMGPPAFLCQKTLTPSDANRNHNRLAIPRKVVNGVLFPLMNKVEKKEVYKMGGRIGGGGLRVTGHDGAGEQRSLSLCFKFWQSNKMFLINDGWKFVVERNALRPQKDIIELWCFRDAHMALHFAFCVIKGEEVDRRNEEGNGVAEDGAVVPEGQATSGDDRFISVMEKRKNRKKKKKRITGIMSARSPGQLECQV